MPYMDEEVGFHSLEKCMELVDFVLIVLVFIRFFIVLPLQFLYTKLAYWAYK